MKERFCGLMGGKSSAVTFGTFHAVSFMILKHAYHYYQAENIIREEQRVSRMREIIKAPQAGIMRDESEFIAALLGEIGLVKTAEFHSIITIPRTAGKRCSGEFTASTTNISMRII